MTRVSCAALALLLLAACPSPSAGRRSTAPPTPPARFDPPARPPSARLPDGITVVQLAPRTPGFFAVTLLVPAGPLDEPVGLEGLTELTLAGAALATSRDPDHAHGPYHRALELGGRLAPHRDGVLAGWRVSGPTASRGALLRLLRDLLVAPTFPSTRVQALAETLREEREQTPSHVRARGEAWAVGLALDSRRPLGADAPDHTLARVNREDLARHHRRVFRPERAVAVSEGVPADVIAQALRDWRPPPPFPRPTAACEVAPGPRGAAPPAAADLLVNQGWLAAPDRDAGLFVALEVPGPGDPLRPALDALLFERGALDGAGPDVSIVDRGDRAALVLFSDDVAPPLAAAIDRWLAQASRPLGPQRGDLGARLRRASALIDDHDPTLRAVAAAMHSLGLQQPTHAGPRDDERGAVLRILNDPDRRIRVVLGDARLARALERWGPVTPLARRADLCAR